MPRPGPGRRPTVPRATPPPARLEPPPSGADGGADSAPTTPNGNPTDRYAIRAAAGSAVRHFHLWGTPGETPFAPGSRPKPMRAPSRSPPRARPRRGPPRAGLERALSAGRGRGTRAAPPWPTARRRPPTDRRSRPPPGDRLPRRSRRSFPPPRAAASPAEHRPAEARPARRSPPSPGPRRAGSPWPTPREARMSPPRVCRCCRRPRASTLAGTGARRSHDAPAAAPAPGRRRVSAPARPGFRRDPGGPRSRRGRCRPAARPGRAPAPGSAGVPPRDTPRPLLGDRGPWRHSPGHEQRPRAPSRRSETPARARIGWRARGEEASW